MIDIRIVDHKIWCVKWWNSEEEVKIEDSLFVLKVMMSIWWWSMMKLSFSRQEQKIHWLIDYQKIHPSTTPTTKDPFQSHSQKQSIKNTMFLHNDEMTVKPSILLILPQVHLRKPCYDFCFL